MIWKRAENAHSSIVTSFFFTLAVPTRPMIQEAITAGYYDRDRFGTEYPKLQILIRRGGKA